MSEMCLILIRLILAAVILQTLNGTLHQITSETVENIQLLNNNFGRQFNGGGGGGAGCPLCDSSVFDYCDFKLYHDACCCSSQFGPAIGPGCQFTNCQIFYAKSCYEHNLIRTCCCENQYQ